MISPVVAEALPAHLEFVHHYFDERQADPNFVMVELGHRGTPVFKQQAPFTGNRAYIGIEANLRDPSGIMPTHMQNIKNGVDGNVFFVDQDVGGHIVRDVDYETEKETQCYKGDYDATTLLPDGAASEVFLSNVLSDPSIAGSERVELLLAEAARLVPAGGIVIARETITPLNISPTDFPLASLGLKAIGRVKQAQAKTWDRLEACFNGEGHRLYSPYAFYLFLGKTAHS